MSKVRHGRTGRRSKYASQEEVDEWLIGNDVRLYEQRVQRSVAKKLCESDIGKPVTAKAFKRGREKHCKFWTVLRSPLYSTSKSLTWRQWDKLRQWAEANRLLIRRPDASLELAARLMRAEGMICSPDLLKNSCSFMAIWREERSGAGK